MWVTELYGLCQKIIQTGKAKVRFTLSSSANTYLRVLIAEDGQTLVDDGNCYQLSPKPQDWSANIMAYRLCKLRLQRIARNEKTLS